MIGTGSSKGYKIFGAIQNVKRKLQANSMRSASILYPTTSQRWDNAMVEAETMVGNSSDFSNLHKMVSGEFTSITKYLQKLIGTNHPMLETAKRCTYISEGKMGSAQARGLIVILTAKASENSRQLSQGHPGRLRPDMDLIKDQVSLAEMTEITYSAYMMHRGVMDLKVRDKEDIRDESDLVNEKNGIHYGNKVSILCGDFLLAYVMRGLGDLFSSQVVNLVASAIKDFMEGEFLLIEDWTDRNYLLTDRSRDPTRWERRSISSIGSLQGNTCQGSVVLAGADDILQKAANEFGKNLSLAWQAHTEIQPFRNEYYEPIQLAEMLPFPAFDLNCLPVILFLKNSYGRKNFRLLINEVKSIETSRTSGSSLIRQHLHQELVDYEKLHKMVRSDKDAIGQTYRLIRNFSQEAIKHLMLFKPSEARDMLEKICVSLHDDTD